MLDSVLRFSYTPLPRQMSFLRHVRRECANEPGGCNCVAAADVSGAVYSEHSTEDVTSRFYVLFCRIKSNGINAR